MKGTLGTPDTPDQQRLAWRVAGVLWTAAAVTMAAVLLLPGTDTSHWPLIVALAAGALAWGLFCLLAPTSFGKPLVFLVPSALALAVIAAGVAATGGHD